jgi:hypothetical protein
MSVNIYDNQGRKVGRAEEDNWVAFLLALGFVGFLGLLVVTFVRWLSERVVNWQQLETPYRYVGAYYDHTLHPLLVSFVDLWHWCSLNATPEYPNLSLTLSVLAVLGYAGFLAGLSAAIVAGFDRWIAEGIGRPLFFVAILGPALFVFVWFVGEAGTTWLLAGPG